MARHVKTGDSVVITAGNDKGRTGKVISGITDKDRVSGEGIKVRKKFLKPTQQRPQGGEITQEMPIHISNVSPVVDGKPSRVRFVTKDDGTKVRVAVRGNKELHTLHGPRS